MTAGVYAIVNTVTGMTYIGSSRDVESRWKGRQKALNQGRSSNKALQADWLASDGAGFELRILEERSNDSTALVEAEQRWLEAHAEHCYNVRMRVWRSDPGEPLPRLQAIRKAAGFSLRRLAVRAGVTVGTIVRLESGRGGHTSTVHKLADALGVEYFQLESPEREAQALRWRRQPKRRRATTPTAGEE